MIQIRYTDIGGAAQFIEFDASVNETHVSTVTTTNKAVERGFSVTDHVRQEPDKLSVQAMVSDHPVVQPGTNVDGAIFKVMSLPLRTSAGKLLGSANVLQSDGIFSSRVSSVYNELLAIQRTKLVSIVTSIRTYDDMVITNLSTPRNVNSSNAVTFSFDAINIRVVDTNTVVGKQPPRRNAKQNKGSQAKKEVTKKEERESLLHKGGGDFVSIASIQTGAVLMSLLFRKDYVLRVDTLEITDADISFKITKTLKAEPNKAEIKIFDLNPDHRAQPPGAQQSGHEEECENQRGTRSRLHRQPLIHLRGHDQLCGCDSRRQRRCPEHVRHGWWTGNAHSAYRTVFPAWDERGDRIGAACKALGVGTGNSARVIKGAKIPGIGTAYAHGYMMHGRVATELDSLLLSAGYEWSVQDGALQIKPAGEALAGAVLEISDSTGLLGTPTASLAPQDPTKKTKTERAVTLHTLLIPSISPGAKVNLVSETFNGTFEVIEMVTSGDTATADWGHEIKAVPL